LQNDFKNTLCEISVVRGIVPRDAVHLSGFISEIEFYPLADEIRIHNQSDSIEIS